MHKLGDIVTTEEEEEKFRRIKEKIRSILTARRNLYNAGVELLECDRVYAEGIKAELCSLLGYNLLPFQRMYARYMTDIPNLPDFRLFLCLMYRIF